MRNSRYSGLLICLLLALALVVAVPLKTNAGTVGAVVDLVLTPATLTINTNNIFEIILQAQCNGQDVAGVDAYINFDAKYLEVQSITQGTTLTTQQNSFDNIAGTINFLAKKTAAPLPSSNFTVATISLKAKAAAPANIAVFFSNTSPRETNVSSGTSSVLRKAVGAALAFPGQSPTPPPTSTPTAKPAATPGTTSSPTATGSPTAKPATTAPASSASDEGFDDTWWHIILIMVGAGGVTLLFLYMLSSRG